MNQSKIDPPPPPNFPPPPQNRRSRRSKQEEPQGTVEKEQDQHPPQQFEDTTVSERTAAHGNTTPCSHLDDDHAQIATAEEQKTAMHAMEVENASLCLPDPQMSSRFPRSMPWSKHPFDPTVDGIMGSFGGSSTEGLYFGDVMTSFPLEDADSIRPNYSTDSTVSRLQRFRVNVGAALARSFSPRGASKQEESDEDSLSDFQEWTPPDSAYGAAFPVCGWVPKHYRRLIEATIIALFVFVLVYFVVTTSIRLSLDQSTDTSDNSTSSSQSKFSDDDYYIDYYNDGNNDDDLVDNEEVDDDAVAAEADDDVEEDDYVDDEQEEEDVNEEDQEENEDDNERLFLRLF